MNHYETLGLQPSADFAAVKAAYRKLARKLHPDTGDEPDATRFHALQHAYDVLADPDQRQRYVDSGMVDAGDQINIPAKVRSLFEEIVSHQLQQSRFEPRQVLSEARRVTASMVVKCTGRAEDARKQIARLEAYRYAVKPRHADSPDVFDTAMQSMLNQRQRELDDELATLFAAKAMAALLDTYQTSSSFGSAAATHQSLPATASVVSHMGDPTKPIKRMAKP